MKNKGLLAAVLAVPLISVSQENSLRPNILWLTYEDTSPQFVGCYGNEDAKTPNIDKLAGQGVRFDNAYSTASVSSPSRFCLITGIPANKMGAGSHRSAYAIPDSIRGFAYYLKQAGYYTSNNYKTDYNIAGASKFTNDAWNESSAKAGWRNREAGQPFFAVHNSNSSHQSRTMTNSWARYEEVVLAKLTENEIVKAGRLEMPTYLRDSPLMQRHLSRVYNSISLMDKEVAEWLNRLEKDGLKDSTIVFCFSDHGEGITRGKGSAVGLGYRVAFVAWFPPMYRHLSPWGSGVITDELVSFDDFAPTMLALAGVDIPAHMQGRIFAGSTPDAKKPYVFSAVDRTDESSELSRSVCDGEYLYTRVFMPFQPFARWNLYYDVSGIQQTIRADYNAGILNDAQRSILQPRESEYLYNIKKDKWEVNNLVNDPSLKRKVKELRTALVNHLVEIRDPHFMTEYAFKEYPEIKPVELASNREEYPIEKVLESAMLAGMGEEVIEQQMGNLCADNQYVRYWAAVALFSQDKESLKHLLSRLEGRLLTENFEPTRVTLIMLLYKLSDSKKYFDSVRMLINASADDELLRMGFHLLMTLELNKQRALLDDVKSIVNTPNSKRAAYDDFITLYIHSMEGTVLNGNDSF